MKTLCILGRQPEISIAELESLYGPAAVTVLNDEAALLDVHPDPDMQKRLGGVIKTGQLFTPLSEKPWKEIEHYLTMTLPSQLDDMPDRKIHLGISLYGLHISLKDLQRTSFAFKKVLKKAGKSIRIIPNKHLALSSAQVFHNHITEENGVELLIVKAKTGKIYIGRTVSVQDIDAYTARDQQRPKRDAKVGMLPPKLAQIIINLAVGTLETRDKRLETEDGQGLDVAQEKSPSQNDQGLDVMQGKSEARNEAYDKVRRMSTGAFDTAERQEQKQVMSSAHEQASAPLTILDPFCGTGVILQEALLMGYHAYGTDLEPRMIDYAGQNLDWLDHDTSLSVQLETADAVDHTWSPLPDVIAGEAYLGRPFATTPDGATLKKVVQDVDTIIKKFLKNVAEQTEPGFRLCLAVPAWKQKHGFTRLPLLDHLEELGYNRQSFVHIGGRPLIYHREDQIVARELTVLVRN